MDAKICHILSAYPDTQVRFQLSVAEMVDLGAAEEFLEDLLPHTVQSSRFKFDHPGVQQCE